MPTKRRKQAATSAEKVPPIPRTAGMTVSLAEGAELRVPDFETPDEAPDSGDLQ